MRTVVLPTTEDTFALGVDLGRRAGPGTLIGLIGDLGAGKTVLAQGVAAGLGCQGRVRSPTFVVMQLHEDGRLPLYHADWYRLGDEAALEHIGFDDALVAGGVVVVEWADRFPDVMLDERLEIHLEHLDPGRRATLHGHGPRHRSLEHAHG